MRNKYSQNCVGEITNQILQITKFYDRFLIKICENRDKADCFCREITYTEKQYIYSSLVK